MNIKLGMATWIVATYMPKGSQRIDRKIVM